MLIVALIPNRFTTAVRTRSLVISRIFRRIPFVFIDSDRADSGCPFQTIGMAINHHHLANAATLVARAAIKPTGPHHTPPPNLRFDSGQLS